jgi:ribosomal 50S subunit-recycling heat shock protein
MFLSSALLLHRRVLAARAAEDGNIGHEEEQIKRRESNRIEQTDPHQIFFANKTHSRTTASLKRRQAS